MFLVPILFLALISCNKSKAGENEVKRVDGTLKYKVLNSDLSVNFIGEEEDFFNAYRRLQLFYLGEYIVWFSGGTKDAYFHVMDSQTGKEVATAGKPGQFEENPLISSAVWNNVFSLHKIYIGDYKGSDLGCMMLDTLLAGRNPFVKSTTEEDSIRDLGYVTRLEDKMYVGTTRKGNPHSLMMYLNGETSTFGSRPIKGISSIGINNFKFDSIKRVLVSFNDLPKYLAVHELKNGKFELLFESRANAKYVVTKGVNGGEAIQFLNEMDISGRYAICLTKDYIVAIERDRKFDRTLEGTIRHKYGKWPQTLFVYDYNTKLLEIINYHFPIAAIDGDLKSNTVYAIVKDPYFRLIKIQL